MKEIRKQQGPDEPTFLIPRISFEKLVRETMGNLGQSSLEFRSDALVLFQECADWHIRDFMARAQKVACHRTWVALTPEDVKLVVEDGNDTWTS